MTEVTAKLKYLHISPRKVRLLANLIRGEKVNSARLRLQFKEKKATAPLLKLLKSAESNAKVNFKLSPDDLRVKKITVDGGPVLKRYMARARGRASTIKRRTSHVTIVLE